ncbi:hypothetical protein [Caenimonas sp. SL110]|uniref:hypothetical protein n=1 Tax=Caenimonas sp. SL110 TaxID=1450524 RepID=UPI00065338B9|nr:hypothetical protein [Caenimonas sp. SL110]
MPPNPALVRALAIALVAAAVLNGLGFYLKRVGLMDYDKYRGFWSVHCHFDVDHPSLARERQCAHHTTPPEILAARNWHDGDDHYRHVYEVPPSQRWLKLAKDLFFVTLVGLGVWFATRSGELRRRIAQPAFVLFVSYLSLLLVTSLLVNGLVPAAAGFRSLFFVGVALTAGWLVPRLHVFAVAAAALIAVELAAVPFELWRGIHLFGQWSFLDLARRASGTLVQPNSLGVFAVCSLAFYFCFARGRRAVVTALLCATALLLVLASGSGTGLACFVATALLMGWLKMPGRLRIPAAVAGVLLAFAAALALPSITGRIDIFDSLWGPEGRVEGLAVALFDRGWVQTAFGSGIGINTNFVRNVLDAGGPVAAGLVPVVAALPFDSTLTALLFQGGLAGAVMFYVTLLWASRRDPVAMPFYAAVAICSLTMNVMELFPVNALLGLALAHSAAAVRSRGTAPA